MNNMPRTAELARAASSRTSALVEMLRHLDDEALLAATRLDGWSRLTIVCHLRYGASALLRMTGDVRAGRPTAYYPEGRVRQRPGTLAPSPGEQPGDVVSSLASIAGELDVAWASLQDREWMLEVREPADNPDLGVIPLWRLALSRLLEVDVHGTDLGIGFPDWSTVLVEIALPTRLGWLAVRRSNHRDFDRSIIGSWLLAAKDGPTWFVAVNGDHVESRPAQGRRQGATATIEGTSRDLLALLLGRPTLEPLSITGDVAFGQSFSRAFPGP